MVSWHPLITVDRHGKIDLSQVVLSDGRGQMINREQLCFLCGQTGGIKMKCDQAGCCEYGVAAEGDGQPLVMHATCARQAGLEVRLDDSDDEVYFYGTSKIIILSPDLDSRLFQFGAIDTEETSSIYGHN